MKNHTPTKFFFIALLALVCTAAKAQINYGDIYNPHFNTHQARYFPGLLGTGFKDGSVDFINGYAWVSNNSVGLKYVRDILSDDELTQEQIKQITSKLKPNTNIFFGADLQVLNAAFKVRRQGWELFTMQVGHRERIMGNLQINRNLFDVLQNGNKQYAGKTVSLGPIKPNAIYFREWNIGVSVPVKTTVGSHTIRLRPAVTAKVIQGIANIYTPRGKADMYTEAEGRYLDFNYDYLTNMSFTTNTKQMGQMLGAGYGMGGGVDLGLDLTLDENLRIDVGLIDLGYVKFTKQVKNYSKKEIYRYEGATLDLFPEGEETVGFNINKEILNPNETQDAYVTPIGAKVTMRIEYRLGKGKLPGKDSTFIYFKHRFFLTYIQGTQTVYNTTTTPNFSVGYMYSVKNILNLGLSASFLGYNKFALGPFISVKGGPVVIGFGSNNLMAVMAPKFGTGADAYVNIGFSF